MVNRSLTITDDAGFCRPIPSTLTSARSRCPAGVFVSTPTRGRALAGNPRTPIAVEGIRVQLLPIKGKRDDFSYGFLAPLRCARCEYRRDPHCGEKRLSKRASSRAPLGELRSQIIDLRNGRPSRRSPWRNHHCHRARDRLLRDVLEAQRATLGLRPNICRSPPTTSKPVLGRPLTTRRVGLTGSCRSLMRGSWVEVTSESGDFSWR